MKRKIEKLFVAHRMYEFTVETEPYEQYKSFGKLENTFVVSTRKVLVYSSVDEEGTVRYYLYPSNKEVYLEPRTCSYTTHSSPMDSLYYGYTSRRFNGGVRSINEKILDMHQRQMSEIGFLIPAEEFFNVEKIDNVPLAYALLLLHNTKSILSKRYIALSFDPEEAKEQMRRLG